MSTITEVVKPQNWSWLFDQNDGPVRFIVEHQFLFVGAYMIILVTSILSAVGPESGKPSSLRSTASIAAVARLAFTLAVYAPAFYKVGRNVSSSIEVWRILFPIIGAHIALTALNFLLVQIQSDDDVSSPDYSGSTTRKVIDSIIIPTRLLIDAMIPFSNIRNIKKSPVIYNDITDDVPKYVENKEGLFIGDGHDDIENVSSASASISLLSTNTVTSPYLLGAIAFIIGAAKRS